MKPVIIREPIHNSIILDQQVFIDLINTREFQRLRRVNQLGNASFGYPGATHTRFLHSLGTYQVATRIVQSSYNIANKLDDREKTLVRIAALLHDIGHGPFSHSFEHITGMKHEVYTSKIIMQKTEVRDVLKKHNIEPFEVSSIIDKSHPNPMLVKIISSQVDADRMDYLLRDSYYTGTGYGIFDMAWIIANMDIESDKTIFNQKCIQALENYIVGRHHMYWTVYLHKNSLAQDFLLNSTFTRLKELYVDGYKFKSNLTVLKDWLDGKDIPVNEYVIMDDAWAYNLISSLMSEKDEILSELASRFINRRLPKVVDVTGHETEMKLLPEIKEKYKNKYFYANESYGNIAFKSMETNSLDNTYIRTNDRLVPMEEISPIVKTLTKKPTPKSFIIYIND